MSAGWPLDEVTYGTCVARNVEEAAETGGVAAWDCIYEGAVHVPAEEDWAPSASTNSSPAFVVVTDGAVTGPLTVVPLELTSIGVTGFTRR